MPLGIVGLVVALGTLGWLDYRATSADLRALRRSEADTLYDTIAAAARVQHAAATAAEAALGQRLLEHAKVLAAFDRRGALDEATVKAIAASTDVFRIVIFDPSGRRELMAGEAPPGWGRAGRGIGRSQGGPGSGQGMGAPAGATRVAQRLLAGDVGEFLSTPHASRQGGERIAAGVRRANGGAIVVNASNRLASELDSVYSLDALVQQIVGATPALGYIVLENDEGGRVAGGPLAPTLASGHPASSAPGSLTSTGALPVLERRGTVTLDDSRTTTLRIGMRLDDVRRAETRALLRIGGGLGAVAAAAIFGIAFGALRARYGALSRRHAQAQEALRRRDRLSAMGEMASTVAHEIRNPLNAIAMSAQRLAREYPAAAAADDRSELVDIIQRESTRINGTVQQFLDFARPRPPAPRELDLGALLAECAAASTALAAARGVRLEVEPGASAWVRADRDQLRQAIDNVLRNAIEATPEAGVVRLFLARRGREILVGIEDTGAGIPADTLPRIFDLYFTTKREGTGVGLAVVQQILAAHGGTVDVVSQPGQGTRVTLQLPRDGVPID